MKRDNTEWVKDSECLKTQEMMDKTTVCMSYFIYLLVSLTGKLNSTILCKYTILF